MSDQSRAQRSMFTAYLDLLGLNFKKMMFSVPNDPVWEDIKSDAKDNCSHCAGRKKVSHAAESGGTVLQHIIRHKHRQVSNLFRRGRLIWTMPGEFIVGLVERLQLLLGIFSFLVCHSERENTKNEAQTVNGGQHSACWWQLIDSLVTVFVQHHLCGPQCFCDLFLLRDHFLHWHLERHTATY